MLFKQQPLHSFRSSNHNSIFTNTQVNERISMFWRSNIDQLIILNSVFYCILLYSHWFRIQILMRAHVLLPTTSIHQKTQLRLILPRVYLLRAQELTASQPLVQLKCQSYVLHKIIIGLNRNIRLRMTP